MAAVVGFSTYHVPGPGAAYTGHMEPPYHQREERRRRLDKPPKKKTKEKYILGQAWAPLLSLLVLPPILWRHSPYSDAPHPRGAQKF